MPRFFVQKEEIADGKLKISGADGHHIVRVLRMKAGDILTVCDFFNTEYLCEILETEGETVYLKVLSEMACATEPPFPVKLYMALPKADKMELIIQKAVELGVSEIIPFISAFTVVKPDEKGKEKKKERWQKIAKSAAEQCGRGCIPTVLSPISYKQALERCQKENGKAFLCYEREESKTLKDFFEECKTPSSLSFFVGAEGGFSEKEAEAAAEAGVVSVSLGKRILRCETAPIYVLSALGYCYEL